MTSAAELFTFTLLATSGLYAGMLAYFNGLLGTKRENTPLQWNSEPILWFLSLMFMISLTFRFSGIDPAAPGPGVWYLTGTGPLLIAYIYLILKLARHAVLQQLFWMLVAMGTVAIVYVASNIFAAVFTDSLDPYTYAERIGTLLLSMTVIVCLILLWCFLVSLWTSMLMIRATAAGAPERQTARARALSASEKSDFELQPGEDVALDFGKRLVEDHGYKADLRVARADSEHAIRVEVSNDNSSWIACELDGNISTDYDVPYIGSPWRYVRIHNVSDEAVQIDAVFDLD